MEQKAWVYDDDNVAKKYLDHKGKRKILLWCYTGLGTEKKERETRTTYKGKEMKRSSNYDSQLEKKHKSIYI